MQIIVHYYMFSSIFDLIQIIFKQIYLIGVAIFWQCEPGSNDNERVTLHSLHNWSLTTRYSFISSVGVLIPVKDAVGIFYREMLGRVRLVKSIGFRFEKAWLQGLVRLKSPICQTICQHLVKKRQIHAFPRPLAQNKKQTALHHEPPTTAR